MIPTRLDDWTYEAIKNLCALGQSESETHDFKADIRSLENLNKICCAFANTRGGFIVIGVAEKDRRQFSIEGVDPDREIYGNFTRKIHIEPSLDIGVPKVIGIPEAVKVLYVFEIPCSSIRPHIPLPKDDRAFWKRAGSDCARMSLEEVRFQMSQMEEKRESLLLLLIEFSQIRNSLLIQSRIQQGYYNGHKFDFGIINQCISKTISLTKSDKQFFESINYIKSELNLFNFEQDKINSILSMSYEQKFKTLSIEKLKEICIDILERTSPHFEYISDYARKEHSVSIF